MCHKVAETDPPLGVLTQTPKVGARECRSDELCRVERLLLSVDKLRLARSVELSPLFTSPLQRAESRCCFHADKEESETRPFGTFAVGSFQDRRMRRASAREC